MYRWDSCIVHRGNDVEKFVDQYLGKSDRKIFLVAGAGFDPRACTLASRLRGKNAHIHAFLVKEERPNPPQSLLDKANTNRNTLTSAFGSHEVKTIEVFDADGAVIGGHNVMKILRQKYLDNLTDVVVDVSALSVGISFPIIRYFTQLIANSKGIVNLHLFVAHDPNLDARIRATASDSPSYVRGFDGKSTLYDTANAARLWLPLLATGRRQALTRLYEFVDPHDTCPILPFPAGNPRLGDELVEEYLTEFESTWEVDARNIVYADENDPLDLYRTILRLDDFRQKVFHTTGGSMLILSPLGSKVMALGTLLAAIERDLPVAHLEPIGYNLQASTLETMDPPNLVHIWLEGEAYPQPRPALPTG